MTIMKKIALLGAIAVLSACTSAPQIVNHYQMYLPTFPSLLVTPTAVEPPPDRAAYMAATDKQREQMLMKAYINQTGNVNTCNVDKTNVTSWYTQQQAVVAKANAASGVAAVPLAASGAQAKQ
jgi:hypothetical protein